MNKTIYTITFIMLFSIQFSVAQSWTEVNPGFAGKNYIALDMPSTSVIYVSGYEGTIIKSTDGGSTWAQLSTETDINFECVEFISESTGFAAGSGNEIIHTSDGGSTWNSETVSGYKYGLSFPSASIGYVCGDEGMLYKYESESWNELTSGTSRVLYDIHFHDENNGFIFGGFFDTDCVLKKTVDGGTNWTNITTPNEDALYGVHFPTVTVGYAVGWDGNIIKTTDGGDTWTELSSGSTEVLQKVFFVDENTGYVTGTSGVLLKTTDGGANWNQESISITDDLYGIYFDNPNLGFAVGTNENILKYSVPSQIENRSDEFMVYPNPVTDYLQITVPEETFHGLELYDMTGKKLLSFDITGEAKINLESLQRGVYIINLVSKEKTITDKIIKQ